MSSIQHLAELKRITGHTIRLDLFDEVRDIKITDEMVSIGIDTAKYTGSRGRYRITKRGIILHVFRRDESTGVWSRTATVPVWWSTDEAFVPSVRDADPEWEQMCYRPGNHRNPQDGPLARP